jgi:hypothetical protein
MKTFTTHSCPPLRHFCSLNLFSHRILQGSDWDLSPHMLSPCGLTLSPTCLLVTVNESRSYFVSNIHSFRVAVFLSLCLFYYYGSRFLHRNTWFWHIICQLSSLFAIRKKVLTFVACFNRHFEVLPFQYFTDRVLETCYTCYRYYSSSMLTEHLLSVLAQTLSSESPFRRSQQYKATSK